MLSVGQRIEFLKEAGWSGATETPVGEDWSQRKIFRVQLGGRSAILMHAVPDDDPRATPGHKLRDYIAISKFLRSIEISAPQVYAQDLPHGLLLVEDFGNDMFSNLMQNHPEQEADLYMLATKTLVHIYKKTEFIPFDLPDYYKGYIHPSRRRVVDWYMPAVLGRKNEPGLAEDFLRTMALLEKGLPPVRRRFLHSDYHPGNLMWLPERNGIQQTGLVDFQGAHMGPAPYDLVNLLDDARRIVPEKIKDDCIARFALELHGEERESFLAWYPVLACQFHSRVIGQAIRLAIRDNKTRLLALMPTLREHMLRDLSHPVLAPLKDWFAAHKVDFGVNNPIDLAKTAPLIGDDAV